MAAIKVGEAYYEIYPRINQRAADAARRVLGAQLADDFGKTQTKIRNETDRTTDRIIGNEKTVDKQREVSYKREILRNNALNRILVRHSNDRLRVAKREEGALHKLATQFRTIGTLARGIGFGAGLLSGFSLLQGALGAIIALGPVAGAALAAIPVAIVGIGVEAVILKGAMKGVGTAISDAFDPTKAKQFQEDLKALTPAARQFVLNIKKAAGILPNIQQTFFSQGSLQQASKQIAPFFATISGSFRSLIAANGNLFGQLLGTVTNGPNSKRISDFLGNIARIIREITPGINNLATGFITFLDNISKAANGKGISDFLTKFGNFLAHVNAKGLFDAANASIRGFSFLLSTLSDIIGGVIKAFGGTDHLGEQFFKNLGQILTEISTFVNSSTGQTFLKDLIGTLNVLSSLANTVIKDGLGFIAATFAGLYPSIKPFVDVVKRILNDVFTPELGKTLGEIASHLLDIGTQFLNFVEPAIRKLVDLIADNPTAFTDIAEGIGAIYLGLKIQAGVSAIALSVKAIREGLVWFSTKAATAAAANMGGIAAGETAMGAGGLTGAAGVQALIGKIIGVAGLLFALQAVQDFAKQHGWDSNSGAGLIPLGKGSDSSGFKDSPFAHFIGYIRNGIEHLSATVLPALINKWTELKGKVEEIAGAIGTAFDGLKTIGAKAVANVKKYIVDPVAKAFGTIANGVQSAFNTVLDTIRTNCQWLLDHTINPLIDAINKIPGVNIPHINLPGGSSHPPSASGGPSSVFHGLATGGPVKGKGGPKSDSIQARLSNGEFVVNAEQTKKFRKLLELINSGQLKGFAGGGIVGGSTGASISATFTSGGGVAFQNAVKILLALRQEVDKAIQSFQNLTKQIKAEYDKTTANSATFFKTTKGQYDVGFGQIDTKVKTLPTVLTIPVQAQYNIVEAKTKTMWGAVNTHFGTGLNDQRKLIAGLPGIFTIPTRNVYNQVIKATVGVWNNIGKQFTQGVKNMGSATGQIVKAVTPGVQGLVKTYTENVKKVWDAVAVPLKLAKLSAVSFSAAAVSVGNVVPPPSQTPIYVADGGPIRGPGGPREDKVQAWLSNGEFVVNAKQAAYYRPLLDDINDGRLPDVDWSFKDGGILKLAGGGPVYAPNGKRSGKSWPVIRDFVRSLDATAKRLTINATTGGGHIRNSYHYSGEAIDWGGTKSQMNHVAKLIWQGYSPLMLELIHSPSYFAHNGIKETAAQGKRTYSAVYGNHFGHIHTAMTKEAAKVAYDLSRQGLVYGQSGNGGDGGGPVVTPITDLQANAIRDATATNIPGTTVWDNMMRQTILQNLTKLQQVTVTKANAINGLNFNGVGTSAQIEAWINAADTFTDIPDSWRQWLRYIIHNESGGNPRAVNRTDINAQQGHPSQGLMQLIPSNFAAYHDGALNDILNPVSSIVAGINYIKARYGDIFHTPWALGTGTYYKDGGPVKVFDQGGILDEGWNHLYNATGRPERLANVTDGGPSVDVNLTVDFRSEEARKMINVEIDKKNRQLVRVLTAKRGGR